MQGRSHAPQVDGMNTFGFPVMMMGGVSQKVTVNNTSAQSVALGQNTTLVRLYSDVDCWLTVGADPTALADGTHLFLPGGVIDYFGVTPGSEIAVIRATSSDGTLYISEGA